MKFASVVLLSLIMGCNAFSSLDEFPESDVGRNEVDVGSDVDTRDTGNISDASDLGVELDMETLLDADMPPDVPVPVCGSRVFPAADYTPTSLLMGGGGLIDESDAWPDVQLTALPGVGGVWEMLVGWSDSTRFAYEHFRYSTAGSINASSRIPTEVSAPMFVSGGALQRLTNDQVGFNILGRGCVQDEPLYGWFAMANSDTWDGLIATAISDPGGDCNASRFTQFPAFAGGYNGFDGQIIPARWVWFGEDSLLRTIVPPFGPTQTRTDDGSTDLQSIYSTSGRHVVVQIRDTWARWEANPEADPEQPQEIVGEEALFAPFAVAHLRGDRYVTINGTNITLWEFAPEKNVMVDSVQLSVAEPSYESIDLLAASISPIPGGFALFLAEDRSFTPNGRAENWSIALFSINGSQIEYDGFYRYSFGEIDVLAVDSVALIDGCDLTMAVAVMFERMTGPAINVEFVPLPERD